MDSARVIGQPVRPIARLSGADCSRQRRYRCLSVAFHHVQTLGRVLRQERVVIETPALLSLTPLLPAGDDLARAIVFYEGVLGFTVRYRDDSQAFAIVGRGNVELFLNRYDDRHVAEQTSVRINVANVRGLYDEYRAGPFDDKRASGARITTLDAKPWGTTNSRSSTRPGCASPSTSASDNACVVHSGGLCRTQAWRWTGCCQSQSDCSCGWQCPIAIQHQSSAQNRQPSA